MCISAGAIAAVSVASAAVGTISSIGNAKYQAGMAELQLQEQRDAIRRERESATLRALEAQTARVREFEDNRAANLAMMAGSGVTNYSYLQGIERSEEEALRFDLTNIRLGAAGDQNRLAQENRSTQYASQINRYNRNQAVVGSLLNFAGQAASAYSGYQQYRTPSSTPRLGSVNVNGGGSSRWRIGPNAGPMSLGG